MATYPEIDRALQNFGFYRLEPGAALPGRDAVAARAASAAIALPDDFAYFCATYGAGAFDKTALLALPPGCPLGADFRLDTLYAVGAREDWDPLTLLEETYLDRLPQGFIPVATDPGGNLLVLGSAERAAAYVWDHEHRELANGELERRAADLRRANVDVQQLDIDQILLLWDETFPDRVRNPSGYGNLYRVAASFEAALTASRG